MKPLKNSWFLSSFSNLIFKKGDRPNAIDEKGSENPDAGSAETVDAENHPYSKEEGLSSPDSILRTAEDKRTPSPSRSKFDDRHQNDQGESSDGTITELEDQRRQDQQQQQQPEVDPFEVTWDNGDDDPLNPRSMRTSRKWLIVVITCFGSLCV